MNTVLAHSWDSIPTVRLVDTAFKVIKHVIPLLREGSFFPERISRTSKKDWSPCTQFDTSIEKYVRDEFLRNFPNIRFCGEEMWWDLDSDELTLVIDPIDGTNSFLSHGSSYAFVLSLHERGAIRAVFVVNPSTGEIFYSKDPGKSTLLLLGFWSSLPIEWELPTNQGNQNGVMLLNIQNSRRGEVERILHKELENIRLRSIVSWSPSLQVANTAKGFYTYVCDYRDTPATPYDLSAGVHILRNAWWSIVDIQWDDVWKIGYQWIFVAGVCKDTVDYIVAILKKGIHE